MAGEPEIERNIPIPPVDRPLGGAKGKYGPIRRTLEKLYIGQSFQFFEEDFYKVRGAIARIHKEHPDKHFTTRTINEDGRYRVWRVKK